MISSIQVLAGMQYFDANHDGQVSQDELPQGLNKLKASGQSASGNGAQLYSLGDMLLKNKGRIGRFCDYLCPKSIILCRVYVGNYL